MLKHLVNPARFPLFVIAGPCVIESAEVSACRSPSMSNASALGLGLGYIFKASFDKANRSSNSSFRGPGLTDGLATLNAWPEKWACRF